MIADKLYQVASAVLLALLVLSCTFLGYKWWDAASDRDNAITARDVAQEELVTMTVRNRDLTASVKAQNDAISRLADEAAAADERALTLAAKIAPISKKVDNLAIQIETSRKEAGPMPTCEDGVHLLNQALEGLR